MYFSIFRVIKSITITSKAIVGNVATYKYWNSKKQNTRDFDILFPDGIVSINNQANVLLCQDQDAKTHSLLYNDQEAEIANTMELQNGDVFFGRLEACIVCRKSLKQLEIKNQNTSLREILERKIDNDNAFLSALQSAVASPTYNGFSSALSSSIATYISENTQINNLIISLLK